MIPKFINLLRRKKPLLIHGDGLHTRRYLYAGDAAEAFDTILHRGELGQTYNVDSEYEFSNLEVARKLLGLFEIAADDKTAAGWIRHTKNRAFNDRRYAVDGSKLRKLGWVQRTSFDEALEATVNWYNRFPDWWGDIEGVLSAHPVVQGDHVMSESIKTVVVAESSEGEAAVGAHDDRKAVKMAAMANGHANGHTYGGGGALGGAKKRKAEHMTEE